METPVREAADGGVPCVADGDGKNGRAGHGDADAAGNRSAPETAYPGKGLPDGAVFWLSGQQGVRKKLPVVYNALGMEKPEPVLKVCYAQMSKQFLRRDSFECVLCGGRMVYRRAVTGLNVQGLKIYAREISLMRYIPG